MDDRCPLRGRFLTGKERLNPGSVWKVRDEGALIRFGFEIQLAGYLKRLTGAGLGKGGTGNGFPFPRKARVSSEIRDRVAVMEDVGECPLQPAVGECLHGEYLIIEFKHPASLFFFA